METKPITKKMIEERLQILKAMQIDCDNGKLIIQNHLKSGREIEALRNVCFFINKAGSRNPKYECTIKVFEPIHARKWIEKSRELQRKYSTQNTTKTKNKLHKQKPKNIKTMLTLDGRRKYKLKPITNETYVISHYQLQIKKLFGWRNVNGLVFASIKEFNSKIQIITPEQIKLN